MDRDLSSHDLWEDSLARSRRRREAAASAKGFELPARGLSVAALVAVTGGTVATVAVAGAVGGDDSSGGGSGSGPRPAAVAKAPERAAKAKRVAASTGAAGTGSASGSGASASSTSTAAGSSAGATTSGAQSAAYAADGSSTGAPTLEQRAEAAAKGVPVAKVASADAPVASDASSPDTTTNSDQSDQQDVVSGQPTADAPPAPTPEQRAAEEPAAQQPDADAPAADAPVADNKPADGGSDGAQDAPKPAGGVPELQQKLGVAPDGDFGPGTEHALKQWQRAHGLTADGVAGPQTREALGIGDGKVLKRDKPAPHHAAPHKAANDGPAPKQAPAGGGVRELQQALGIGVDGVFGPGTEQALKQWQQAHGLDADGVAGPATRQALGIGDGKVLKRRGGKSGGGSGSGSSGDSSVIARVIAAANRIASTPYVYGGGHGSFESSGYDCSGSVSYALHGGGLLDSPLDSSALESYGAPGPGAHITIYANAGHAYMTIDGRRFDTSAQSETGGSRWSSTQRSSSGYVVRHPKGF